MNNPNESKTPAHYLTPCIDWVMNYLSIDPNGRAVAEDYLDATLGRTEDGEIDRNVINDPFELMHELNNVIYSRYETDVVEEINDAARRVTLADVETLAAAGADDTDDRRLVDRFNALAVMERAVYFGPEIYAETFMDLAPYVLRNRHPEDVA